MKYETSRRIQVKSLQKIDEIAKDLDLSQKRTIDLAIEIAYQLNKQTKGYLKLFADPRLKIKFYFDEDHRTEVHF